MNTSFLRRPGLLVLLLSGALVVAAAGGAKGADLRLLLVRDASYKEKCTSCIPGRVFGVPEGVEITSAEWLEWALDPISDTIELGYEENEIEGSSIPTGVYSAVIRTDPTKEWMKATNGETNLDRAWRLELKDVPGGRTRIQFHFGKDVGWSTGCIIVGRNASAVCQEDCRFSDSPEAGVRRLREYVEGHLVSSDDEILVRIVDSPTLP